MKFRVSTCVHDAQAGLQQRSYGVGPSARSGKPVRVCVFYIQSDVSDFIYLISRIGILSISSPTSTKKGVSRQVFFHIWEHNPGLLHKLAEQIQAGSAAPAQVPEHSPELALVRVVTLLGIPVC